MPKNISGRGMLVLFAILLLGLVLNPSTLNAQVNETAVVAGFVKAADGNTPIADATVRLLRKEMGQTLFERVTQSGPQGGFEFMNLPAGHYVLKTSAIGFAFDVKEFNLAPGQVHQVEVLLVRPMFGVIEGVVKRASDGAPIPGATVLLISSTSNVTSARTATTNLQGVFRFGEVFAGSYHVEVSKQGYAAQSQDVVMPASGFLSLTFELQQVTTPQGSIRGKVTSSTTGEPIAGAKVYYSPSIGILIPQENATAVVQFVVTNKQGIYEIGQLSVGTWQLSVVAQGFFNSNALVEVKEGTLVTQDFVLEKRPVTQRGSIAGLVTDVHTGAVLPGVRIYFGPLADQTGTPYWWDNAVQPNVPFVTTNLEGRYKIEALVPGVYHLLAVSPNHEPQHQEVQVVPGVVAQAPFQLVPKPVADPGLIKGEVKTVAGEPVGGAKVFYQRLPDPAAALNLDPRHPDAPSVTGSAILPPRPFVETNALGEYSIPNLKPGQYHLLVEKAGFLSAKRVVEVPAGGSVVADFILEQAIPGKGTVAGRVIDAVTELPVADAYVSVGPSGDVVITDVTPAVIYGYAVTNGNGQYSIPNIPAGPVSVTASKDGYRVERKIATVKAGMITRVRFALQPIPLRPTGHIVGKVINGANEQPVKEALVTLMPANQEAFDLSRLPVLPRQVMTDASGRFAFKDVPVGDYDVVVTRKGFERASQPVVVEADQTSELTFLLTPLPEPRFGRVGGNVQDEATSQPLANVWIHLKRSNGETLQETKAFTARTNESGNFLIERVPAGAYLLTAVKFGYETTQAPVNVPPEQRIDVAVRMKKITDFGVIQGYVLDAVTQEPIREARVFIPPANLYFASNAANALSALTNAAGLYRIEGVPVGQCTVVATHPKHLAESQITQVMKDQTVNLNFSLLPREKTPMAQVKVRAIDARTGNHITGAVISLPEVSWVEPGSTWDTSRTVTDNNGYATIQPNAACWPILGLAASYQNALASSSSAANAVTTQGAAQPAAGNAPVVTLFFEPEPVLTSSESWGQYK